MASDTPASSHSASGLTEKEAQEFHKGFMSTFGIFVGIALVAHLLIWIWRPWIPGPDGYASLTETLTSGPLAMLWS